MPQVRIPASLRPHVDHKTVVFADGATVGCVLQNLVQAYPSLESALLNPNQQLHSYLNLFVDEDNIRDLQQLETVVAPHQTILIVPALAGG
jgi:adenylyltransferase/sulfurtransferase